MPTWERRSAATRLALLLERPLVDAGPEHPHRLLAVLELGLLVLHRDDDARRLVRDADGGVGRVHRLAAGPRRSVDVDLELVGRDLDLDLLRLGQHRDGRRRGVDPALRLGLRHPLHAVRPALELEHRVGAVALDLERRVLEAPDLGRREREVLDREPALLGVAGQHLVEVAREQGRLVAAGAGPDLDDHVLVVVRVALDHRQADLLLELLEPGRRIGEDLAQLLVLAALVEQLARSLEVVAKPSPLQRQGVRALELAELAPDRGVALAVADHPRVAHLSLELGEPLLELVDQLLDHRRIEANRPRRVTKPRRNALTTVSTSGTGVPQMISQHLRQQRRRLRGPVRGPLRDRGRGRRAGTGRQRRLGIDQERRGEERRPRRERGQRGQGPRRVAERRRTASPSTAARRPTISDRERRQQLQGRDFSLTAQDVGINALSGGNIAEDSLFQNDIGTSAIGGPELRSNSVQASEIDVDAVGAAEIAARAAVRQRVGDRDGRRRGVGDRRLGGRRTPTWRATRPTAA